MPELSTVRLDIALHGAVSGANVVLELDRYEIDGGIQVPTRYTATVDDNGKASIDVWPNARGSRSSVYNVHITRRGQPLVTGTIALPELDAVKLHDYLESPPFPERPAYQTALIEIGEFAASARNDATTADKRADDAESAAARSESAETSATKSASAASQSASSAGESQKAAESSARDAGSSATRAATSATKATEAADSASDDAAATAQDREAVVSDRERAETAADQTAGLTSWESDGRVLTTPLPVKSPSILRADLPADVPDGARVWVPDCPAPAQAVTRARGAECVSVDGRWVRMSDHGSMFAAIDDVFAGWYGLYTRAQLGLIYQTDDRSTPVAAVDETIGTFADEGRQGLDLVQATTSRRASWTGISARVDGIDDAYFVQTALSLGYQVSLYTAFRYRALTGNDPFRSAFTMGAGNSSFHLGLRADNSSANARMQLSGQLYLDTVDARISDGEAHTIEFAVTKNGLLRLWIDGDLINENSDNESFVAGELAENLVVRLFDGSAMEFIGFVAAQTDPSPAERADIRRYLEFGS